MVAIGGSKIIPSIDYQYLMANVTNMPFKDNEFDTVVDTFGLEYVEDPVAALKEMKR